MSRGALYIVWPGDPRTEDALQRSIASLNAVHPGLPYHVEVMPEGTTLLDKARMCDLSPFDETLFIDADTVVLERLDFAFDRATRHGIAMCICECPWARRFPCCHGDMVEYNTGLIWFDKLHPRTQEVFAMWKRLADTADSRLWFMLGDVKTLMPENDQASFALAVDYLDFNPFVLPMNWNFRPLWHKSWFGPLKVWHDYSDVPPHVLAWNAQQNEPGAIIDYARVK
jgi:hypothetical protein